MKKLIVLILCVLFWHTALAQVGPGNCGQTSSTACYTQSGGGGIAATVNQGNAGTSAQAWFMQAVAGSFLDGWNVTEGTKADAAYAGSGSASLVAINKGIYNELLVGGSSGNPLFVVSAPPA